ncbi:MAG: iron ABC transporter permease [Bacteroidetes bacterium]|nr:iron ABC transporter permease [Bacteroidota bacterium]
MLILLLVITVFSILELSLGSAGISFVEVFSPQNEYAEFVLREIRIPRLLTAILIGAALSFSGLVLQTVFRNPLVGPSVLGISSGASLGVALVTMAGFSLGHSDIPKVFAAILFSMSVLLLLFSVAGRFRDNASVLIVGMLISYLAGAVVDILIFVSDNDALKEYTLWGMGSFSRMNYGEILVVATLLLVAYIIVYKNRHLMNLYLIGELDEVNEKRKKRLIFLLIIVAGIITAFVTAFCGPIAFIGIAIPNLMRFVLKISDHKYLLPGTVLLGAAVAVMCDLLSAMPWSDHSLPVNAVTSLFGIPIIVFMIFKSRHKSL